MTNNEPAMTPDEILAALADYDYALPEKALNAAESMPETMTPLLLEHLERVLSNYDSSSDEDEWIEFYALFLLAKFKEERTLTILRSALDRAAQHSDYFEIPDGCANLFASWAFHNPSALKPFVNNGSYPEHIRSYALEAYIVLYLQHAVSADEMQPYLRELAYEKLVRKKNGPDSWLWFSWAECCIVMGLSEYYPRSVIKHDSPWRIHGLHRLQTNCSRRSLAWRPEERRPGGSKPRFPKRLIPIALSTRHPSPHP